VRRGVGGLARGKRPRGTGKPQGLQIERVHSGGDGTHRVVRTNVVIHTRRSSIGCAGERPSL
jgi:hypothetical protein